MLCYVIIAFVEMSQHTSYCNSNVLIISDTKPYDSFTFSSSKLNLRGIHVLVKGTCITGNRQRHLVGVAVGM